MSRSIFCIKSKDFEWLTDEFMLYCRSTHLRKSHTQPGTTSFFTPCLAAQKRTAALEGNCSSLDFLMLFRKFTYSSAQHRILHLLR